MKTLKLGERSVLGLLMLVLLVGVWSTPVLAAPAEQRDYTRLEYGLKRAFLRADALQDRIDNLTGGGDLVEEFIVDEQAKDQDTARLDKALVTFRTEVGMAQESLNTAVSILNNPAGFDEDGEVEDPQQARETLKTAHRAMQDARQTLFSAAQDLRQAARDYLQDRREQR
jgi:hypothetical protein